MCNKPMSIYFENIEDINKEKNRNDRNKSTSLGIFGYLLNSKPYF